MKIKLSKKEWSKLREHLLIDISYGEGGTFNKLKGSENIYDEKEANKVNKIILKIESQYK